MTANFFGVTLVLLAILMVNLIGAVLARAAQLQYPSSALLELIGLGALQNVSILMPIGLLLGIVLAFGRLYHDSEMTAARACGMGVARIYAPVWMLAVPVTLCIGWLNFYLAPQAAGMEQTLRNDALRAGMIAPLQPGKFRSFNGGSTVIYGRRADRSGDLLDVFIKRSIGAVVETTVARRLHFAVLPEGQSEVITLSDGERLEGVPGTLHYRLIHFEQLIVPVSVPNASSRSLRADERSTAQLLHSSDPQLLAELHWRMGLPIMALVLTVIAVPLGRLRPRQGRYAHVWLAVLVFALYADLASAGKAWLERGSIPPALGLWWIHGLFLLFGFAAMAASRVSRQWHARHPR